MIDGHCFVMQLLRDFDDAERGLEGGGLVVPCVMGNARLNVREHRRNGRGEQCSKYRAGERLSKKLGFGLDRGGMLLRST